MRNSFALFEWTFVLARFRWAGCPKLIVVMLKVEGSKGGRHNFGRNYIIVWFWINKSKRQVLYRALILFVCIPMQTARKLEKHSFFSCISDSILLLLFFEIFIVGFINIVPGTYTNKLFQQLLQNKDPLSNHTTEHIIDVFHMYFWSFQNRLWLN